MKHKLKIQWLPTKTKWTEGTAVYRWDGIL